MLRPVRRAGLSLVVGAALLGGPPVHAQQFEYAHSNGCGNVFLYGWNELRDEAILVRIDRERAGLPVGTSSLELADTRKAVDVSVELYPRPQPHLGYCSDVRLPEEDRPLARLTAESGQLTITLGEPGVVKDAQPGMYEATAMLRNVVFKRADGTTVSMKGPVTLKAVVGWVSG
jgi:hypothetical protein